ncbi:MAG: hypothetical protein MMC33_000762 [Icmadophila ericetorum]|nr:hypothetical protein [Icmadophila ericetorum]
MPPTRITVLISGNGTNLQALIDACAASTIPDAEIIQVISNRKAAYGLQRAEKASIPTYYHNLIGYKKENPGLEESMLREGYDEALAQIVLKEMPHIVVCAGWMHILAPTFLNPIANAGVPVINLHPALPGHFNGAGAIERAYEEFKKGNITKTGVMVHYVISEVDMGEPILVREIDIKPGETIQDLEQKIHRVEWEIIVEGTKVAIERIRLIDP